MATQRVLYKGRKELTMSEYEALTSEDSSIDYDITNYPQNGITNAIMTYALTCEKLFPEGTVFICSDSGTYTKGNTYRIKVTNGVKSWENITPSGGANIQPLYKHELVISYTFTNISDPQNTTATVNGSTIYHYYSNDNSPISNISVVDDMFISPGGIAKNNQDTVLLYDVFVIKVGSSASVNAIQASTLTQVTGTIGTITDTVTQLI